MSIIHTHTHTHTHTFSLVNQMVKQFRRCNAGDVGSIPESGRSLGGGHGNPLQYSCLKNCMDRRARWAADHGVVKAGHD